MSNETKKFAGLESLQAFLDGCKTLFASITHKHTISDIEDYNVDTELSSTSENPVQNKVISAELNVIADTVEALENVVDNKSDADHTHTIESIDGLQEAVNSAADAKFYVVTFEATGGVYHGDLTFAEIHEKFEAGGNMVARIDGTDYIPLLSAASHQIIFSGIYQGQSVALTIDSSDVCTLTTTRLSLASHGHSEASTTSSGYMSSKDKTKLDSINPSAYESKEDAQLKYDEITSAKADWNQNDENAIDYVKNRTHWVEGDATSIVVIPETTQTYKVEITNGILFENTEYLVIMDGVEYICKGIDNGEHAPFIGDSRIVNSDHSPSDVPFYIQSSYDKALGDFSGNMIALASISYAEPGTHTIEVRKGSGNAIYHTLDENFIPETIARASYVNDAISAVKNELLNGAGEAYDTLKELGELIDENQDAIEALETVATNKADKEHSHAISDVTNLQDQLDKKANSGHNHSAAAITTGTISSSRLPNISIAKGGTGATDVETARTNLEVYSMAEVDDKISNINNSLDNIANVYETKDDAQLKFEEARQYTDEAVSQKTLVQIITWEADD